MCLALAGVCKKQLNLYVEHLCRLPQEMYKHFFHDYMQVSTAGKPCSPISCLHSETTENSRGSLRRCASYHCFVVTSVLLGKLVANKTNSNDQVELAGPLVASQITDRGRMQWPKPWQGLTFEGYRNRYSNSRLE
jgi:hypothetical protein